MNLPEDFTKYTKELMGQELFEQYLKGMEEEAPTSIRLNPFKCSPNKMVANEKRKDATEGEEDIIESQVVPWCPSTGRYLSERKNFTFDPLFHAGLYYVQEASSMFVDLVMRQYIKIPVKMLDLCAAPGGKSTAARAALPEGSLLFSNEPMRTRSQILSENLQKFGHPDIIVTNNYPRDYKKSKLQFDVILADVPCSGEGMFRKDEGAIKEWSLSNVNNCWQLQREIVSDIWDCLKPEGILIYSTCTFNAHEDEANVDWIKSHLGAELLPLDIDKTWNITGSLVNEEPMYHFIPGKTKGEGLFMAVLRKYGSSTKEDNNSPKTKKKMGKKSKKGGKEKTEMPTSWLKDEKVWSYTQTENGIYAIDDRWKSYLEEATQSLKVIHAGIRLGFTKGKDLIPDQSLALSTELARNNFSSVELSYQEAIQYLRKEAITLDSTVNRGYVLVTYRNVPLGWVKNLGNRANNLYPQEWKIKSSHIPDGSNDVLDRLE